MRKGTLLILLAAAGFAVLVFVLLLRTQPVKIVQSRLERQGGRVFVMGELRNTGRATGPIDLEIHYYDRAGRALGEDTVKVGPLRAGAEERFQGPARVLGSVEDFSLYLNHGRNPYGN